MELSFLQLSLLFLSILIFFLFHQNSVKNTRYMGIKTYPLVGILPELVKNRHRFLEWITECIVMTPSHTIILQGIGRIGSVITANPKSIEYILKTNCHNYPKGDVSIGMLEDIFGHTVFNSDGEDWQWQRKAASYEFNKRSLQNFLAEAVRNEIVHRLLPLLTKAAEENKNVDLQHVLELFMFDSISMLAFNDDPACLSEETIGRMTVATRFTRAIQEAENIVVGRYNDIFPFTWKIKKLLNIGSERQLKKLHLTLHAYAKDIIDARKKKSPYEYHDLLSRFASNKNTSEELLRNVVISFVVAGRETASSALVWFFWIISSQPDVKEKIREEIDRIRASNKILNETFGYDDLRELHYLHAAVTESMRLFPPIPVDTSMKCLNDDTLPDGTFIRNGWSVTYSAYAMARLEDIWGKECHVYNPERWLENGYFKAGSPFRYPVFHAGPRVCLGKELAYIQIKAIIVAILERFEVHVLKNEGTPELVPAMTLRMKGGLPIKVTAKTKATRASKV